MDPEELLQKINSGRTLKKGEIEEVAALLEWITEEPKLRARINVDDIYGMLLVIGRSKITKFRSVIERYLESKDALTVSLVLEILCVDWALTDEYLEQVINLSLGASWDAEGDARHTALKILGEYLFRQSLGERKRKVIEPKGQRHTDILELLLNILDDDGLDQWTRQIAYHSLCRAAGKDWEVIPSECKLLNLEAGFPDLDHEMLAYLRGLVSSSKSSN